MCAVSATWVLSILILSQPKPHTVDAFAPSLKTRKAPSAQLSNRKQNFFSESKEQFAVDEYLESIDRRFKRIHQRKIKINEDSNQRAFTNAWSWLTNDEALCKEAQMKHSDDALYVLGLADLASRRLLQKHHLPTARLNKGFSNEDDHMPVVDVRGEKDVTNGSFIQLAIASNKLARFTSRIYKAYTYHSTVSALKLRSRFYQMLRFAGSTVQFLAFPKRQPIFSYKDT